MRLFFGWLAVSVLASSPAVMAQQTQQNNSVVQHVTRVAQRSLPSPYRTVSANASQTETKATSVVNSQAQAESVVTIPQQGAVDMGTPYSYTAPADCSASGCAAPACDLAGGCDAGACSTGGGCHLAGLLHHKIGGGGCNGWFGGLYYLKLWRDSDTFGQPLAVNSAVPTQTVLSTGMAHMKDSDGLGIRVGKMLNNCTAVEFLYWQVFPDENPARAEAPVIGSTINSMLSFTDLDYLGTPVDDYFQDSQYQSVSRSFDYRNFELNFIRLPYTMAGSSCGNVRLALLAGFRYFEAEESLVYFSDDLNNIPGDDPLNELEYHNMVDNTLIGFQVGGLMNLQFNSRLSGQFGTKLGIYNNRMEQEQAVVGGGGGATITAGPDAGQFFALRSKKDDVAFLGEVDAGLSYCINNNWRLTGGYKVVAISGYADSVNQIPYQFNSLSSTGLIQDNNSLVLHGIYAGVEMTW